MGLLSNSQSGSIEGFFRLARRWGTVIGCRLFCVENSEEASKWRHHLRILIFFAVLGYYVLGLSMIILTMIPLPSETKGFQLDIPTAFALVWTCLGLDGAGIFMFMNCATHVLQSEDGFFSQYHENFSKTKLVDSAFRFWKRFTLGATMLGSLSNIPTVLLGFLFVSGVFPTALPVNVERANQWTGIPTIGIRILIQLTIFLTCAHVGYYSVLYSGLCELSRALFATYCSKLEKEPPGGFMASRIRKYKKEYSTLVELTDCFDDAFKHTNMCQLTFFMGSACITAYIFVRGGLQTDALLQMIYFAVLTVASFLYTGAPAMMLKAEVEHIPHVFQEGSCFMCCFFRQRDRDE